MVKIVKKLRCCRADKCYLQVIMAFLTFIRRNREFYDDNGNVNGDDDDSDNGNDNDVASAPKISNLCESNLWSAL